MVKHGITLAIYELTFIMIEFSVLRKKEQCDNLIPWLEDNIKRSI